MSDLHTPESLRRLAERVRGGRTPPVDLLAELDRAPLPGGRYGEDVAAAAGAAHMALERMAAGEAVEILRIRAADALDRAAGHAAAG